MRGAALFCLISLCASAALAKLNIVTTIPDFATLASELGGERVSTEALVQGSEDPHFVDAKPSHVLRVNRADLLISVGLGLESGWLPALLAQARNAKVQPGTPGNFEAARDVRLKDVPVSLDRALGDIHAGGNPHFYAAPPEMLRVAEALHERLVALDPEGRAVFDGAWQAWQGKFAQKNAGWLAACKPVVGAEVVEYHKSWIYLLDWLGLVSVGTLEPKPGIPPSPAHVSELLTAVRGHHVRFVFTEVYHSDHLAKVFAEKAGARLVVLPSMVGAEPGIRTLWDKWDRVVQLVCLQPAQLEAQP